MISFSFSCTGSLTIGFQFVDPLVDQLADQRISLASALPLDAAK